MVIGQALVGSDQERAPARAQIERAKERTAGVPAADGHLGLLAAQRSRRTPGRQVAARCFVEHEQASVGGQPFHGTHERPFFWATCGAGSAKTKRGRFQRRPAACRRRRRVRGVIGCPWLGRGVARSGTVEFVAASPRLKRVFGQLGQQRGTVQPGQSRPPSQARLLRQRLLRMATRPRASPRRAPVLDAPRTRSGDRRDLGGRVAFARRPHRWQTPVEPRGGGLLHRCTQSHTLRCRQGNLHPATSCRLTHHAKLSGYLLRRGSVTTSTEGMMVKCFPSAGEPSMLARVMPRSLKKPWFPRGAARPANRGGAAQAGLSNHNECCYGRGAHLPVF